MSYFLLWIETLLAALLFAAFFITLTLRRRRRKLAISFCVVEILLPAIPLGALAVLTILLNNFSGLNPVAPWLSLSLLIVYLVLALVVLFSAKRRNAAGVPASFSWSVRSIGISCLAVFALLFTTFWNLSLQGQMQIQALRAEAGTIALSVFPPEVPDSINAAPLYALADAAIKEATLPSEKEVNFRTLDPQSTEVGDYLGRQGKALGLVRRAGDMSNCRFDYDYLQPDMAALLDRIGSLRPCADLLGVAAKSEAAGGNPKLALDDVRRMYAVADHAGSAPILVSGLLSVAIDSNASQTFAEILPSVTSNEQFEGFALPDPGQIGRGFARSLRGEEAYGLASFCDLASGKKGMGPGSAEFSRTAIATWLLWLMDDVAAYRTQLHEFQHFAETPYYQSASARQALLDQVKRHRSGFLTANTVPSLLTPFVLVAKAQAFREAVTVGVAATRYRLDHHVYAEGAGVLVPAYLDAIPVDPFDGKPMRYKRNGDGSVVIYSVGTDLIDGGGDTERGGTNKAPGDVGLVLRLLK